MKTTMLLLALVLVAGCERQPKEVPAPNPSATPSGAMTPPPTNNPSTVINRPVENPPLTNRAITNAPPP